MKLLDQLAFFSSHVFRFKYFDNPDEEDSIANPIPKSKAKDNEIPSWSYGVNPGMQGKLAAPYAAVDSR